MRESNLSTMPRMLRSLTLGLLAMACASPSQAAPGLVKDISPADADPDRMVDLGGVLLFVADDGVSGVELWRSDGTLAGTTMVADINPGGDADPGAGTGLVLYEGEVYFDADDGVSGVELWRSDGTGIGTVLVQDIRVGPADSNPSGLASSGAGGTLFFAADDGTNGVELWKSGPTVGFAALVSDINVGVGNSNPDGFVRVNGAVYFSADNGTNGAELWKTDGTGPGTALVRDIDTIGSSNPVRLVNVTGTLLFAANDGINGVELWKSDGTLAGTVLVKDIRSGLPSSGPGSNSGTMTNVNGTLFFDANDGLNGRELWRSDGTSAGTTLVKDINAGGGSTPGGTSGLVNVNGTLFFDADDGGLGSELWKSDGTATGTVLVKDIEAGGPGSDPGPIVNLHGTVFINACDIVSGCELWMSDGTTAGTTMVADIQPGPGDSDPQVLTNVAGTLLFSADDGINGVELWGLGVCTSIDPLLPGCVPATSDDSKCSAALGKLTSKLLSADRKCAIKNSDAAIKLNSYAGQSCEDVARYRFLGSIASIQLKDPTCVSACFGNGDPGSRAFEIEASVDAMSGAIYCDATSAVPQDDGFGGFVPDDTTEACADGVARLAGGLAKTLAGCNAKMASAAVVAAPFDLATCQADAQVRFDDGAAGLSGCPLCLAPSEIRDAVVEQTNTSHSASAYCRNDLP